MAPGIGIELAVTTWHKRGRQISRFGPIAGRLLPNTLPKVRSECRQTALSEILERAIGPHLGHFRYGCRPILAPRSPRPRQSDPFMDFCNSPPATGPLTSPLTGPVPSSWFTCDTTARHFGSLTASKSIVAIAAGRRGRANPSMPTLLQRWLLGTCSGAVRVQQLDH